MATRVTSQNAQSIIDSFGPVSNQFIAQNPIGLLDRGDNKTSTFGRGGAIYTNGVPNSAVGGGSGGSGVLGTTNTNPVPQGPTEQEINDIYNPAFGYLGQVEQAARNDLPNALQAADNAFLANQKQAEVGKSASLNQLSLSEQQGTRRKEDALAAARRLFDEVSRGARQRFGGASSAFQAATELQGREAMQNFNQIGTQFNDLVGQIGMKKQEVEEKFQAAILQLKTQAEEAKVQVQRDFQNKLLEIANNRAQLESNKAQMRLQALQDLRNKIFTIDMQNKQFEQTLALQRASSTTSLDNYLNTANQSAQGGQQATQAFGQATTTNPTSQYGVNGQVVQQPATNQYIGQITPQKKDPWGDLIGAVNPLN